MKKETIALIVGGSSGMGFETAKRLHEQGHTVLLLAQHQKGLEKAKAELQSKTA